MPISFDDLINPGLHPNYEPAPIFSDDTSFIEVVDPAATRPSNILIDEARQPVVIVDNLHVKYEVYSSGKAVGNAGARRLLQPKMKGVRTVHALKGITFVAYENESIGVIGSNGSGKSTLLRAITGLTPPSDGAVYARSRPSLLGVGAALIPDLSGDKNITLGGLALGYDRQQVEAMREEIVKFAELEEFIDLPMRTYSSGMAARLKFAIAASKKHDILIIDEALAVGDAKFRKRSEAKIRDIRDGAGTIFNVSHSMNSIKETCDRCIWIEKGVQMMDGDTDSVTKEYQKFQKAKK
ncbi:ABC transporter ATP-binding protein [Glutamicibacter protophormiae]|uniref:ABC transporter ATP-binding protein n=1 Tax=Glutamicibacter protophormiae TaxID=37930 RepID=UPI002A7F3E85|nr:ABC transporter ATP-binding protein [Glutamicibacter protophormiae]WPR66175.1 ABC transporter ATP-binding protein [Glutamicibacter protophormiae]WPR69671.1 ABC transporter ATP-binding protein [Glutamicibacter protophormiae]